MNFVDGDVRPTTYTGVPSGDVDDYVLDDRRVNAPLPGQDIGGTRRGASTDPRLPGQTDVNVQETALIGGTANDILGTAPGVTGSAVLKANSYGGSGTPDRIPVITTEIDPFSGKADKVKSYVKTRTSRQGEAVYREII